MDCVGLIKGFEGLMAARVLRKLLGKILFLRTLINQMDVQIRLPSSVCFLHCKSKKDG